MLPSSFKPTSLNDFIGPARKHAAFLNRLIVEAKKEGAPLKILILGPPGIGKSQIAEHFVREMHANKWSVDTYNGASVGIDVVEDIARKFWHTDMFGDYRVVRFEEIDKLSPAAQVRMLTVLDTLPQKCAIVATSNCKLENFDERFQRRFTLIPVTGPTSEEVLEFLLHRFQLPDAAARQISTFCCGNVGQALMDADLAYVENLQSA